MSDDTDDDEGIYPCRLCDSRATEVMIKCQACRQVFHPTCAKVDVDQVGSVQYRCATCEKTRPLTSATAQQYDSVRQQKRQSLHDENRSQAGAGNFSFLSEKDDVELPEDASMEQVREALTKAREAQKQERIQMIQMMEQANRDAMRKKKEENERHQKQMSELQKFFGKQYHERQREVDADDESSDDENGDAETAKQIAQLQKTMDQARAAMDALSSQTKPKNRNRKTNTASTDKPTHTNERSSANIPGQVSALDKLTMCLNRSYIQKLPEFSGNAKEWPFFESVFNSTTREGNFSQKENIERLGKSLKAPALDLVIDMLMFATDANLIMDELREAYGRPERVIVELMNELIACKSPRDQPEHKLVEFAVKVKNFVASAKSMKMAAQLDNEFSLSKLASKINHSAYREWMKIRIKHPSANIERFSSFLMERVRLIPPALRYDQPNDSSNVESRNRPGRSQGRMMAHHEPSDFVTNKCLKCSKSHDTSKCYRLVNSTLKEIEEFVSKNRICASCLNSRSHGWRDCREKRHCGVQGCEKYHHPLLHDDRRQRSDTQRTNQHYRAEERNDLHTERRASTYREPRQQDASNDRHNAVQTNRQIDNERAEDVRRQSHHSNVHNQFPSTVECSSSVLFKVVPVKLLGNNNTSISTFAFLDDGSSVTLMEKELFEKLHLEGERESLTLQWTKEIRRTEDSYNTTILLTGVKNRKVHKLRNVNTVENLALPAQTIIPSELTERYTHLRGIPISEMINARPQLLIGLKHANLLVNKKCRTGEDGDPVAIKTELGWIIYGVSAPSLNIVALNQKITQPDFSLHMTEPPQMDEELHQIVGDFFTTENFGVTAPKSQAHAMMTEEERRGQEIIDKTLKFKNGRAEVGLLWKSDDVNLPDSYGMAMRRLIAQEKSLSKNPELLEWTNKHIAEMLEKGHARIATKEDLQTKWKKVSYIPTFTIVNQNKIPPKPRLVMDFAAKSGPCGKSVNSELLKGPDNLAPLLSGLCKFRENKVAVNADVKEMFHQIKICDEDQQCQRFLWRDGDSTRAPTIFIFERMGFGAACSPACAQEAKNVHAEKFRKECPEAVDAIVKNTYVDDYQNSHESVEKAFKVSLDAIEIFGKIGFPLVGFQSSHKELLEMLPSENVKQRPVSMDPEEARSMVSKILGMYWEPDADVFTYKLLTNNMIPKMLDKTHHPTKREVLSTIMKIFDPLGLIAHYMIRSKILLQEIWRDGTDWDELIESRLLKPWRDWIDELQNIEKIKIPRQYAPVDPAKVKIQLFVFVDASKDSFAATAYFRFEDNKEIHVAHVMSKSKVAPLKQLSIPKLELQAGVLGVRLAQTIKELHSFKIDDIFYLSDSRVILAWITSHRLKLKQFEALRVSEILSFSTRKDWFHIRSKLNVADDGTKWVDSEMGDVLTRWFQGAPFLKLSSAEWPIESAIGMDFKTEIVNYHFAHVTTTLSFATLDHIAPRFKSNWKSFVRTVACITRWSQSIGPSRKRRFTFVTPDDFRKAEDLLFRKVQLDAFPHEVNSLRNGELVKNSSELIKFTPIMNNDGVIRLSSRTQNASTSYAARNPAVLPNKHEFVDLMIQHYHEQNLHLGEDATIADIRERAWVINIRQAFRRVKSNCQVCKNFSAQPQMPLMGQLPPARLDFRSKPFTHVGIDCFGPYDVKYKRGKEKRWVIIFTCLTFRAVHLELLEDMSKDECMSAIRRFHARRGRSLHFYSDCGTNFIGAENQLKRDSATMAQELGEAVAQQFKVIWHFQPAYSPWWGGAWERMIQSIKKCVEFIVVDETPRQDILRNALHEAEFRMNCRPLTHIPIDHEDEKALTPNSALFGDEESDLARAPGIFTERDAYSKSAYRRSQALADRMFSRWLKEYLPIITRRTKWFKDVKPARVDDIAILINPTQPRDAWKRGRITRVYPGTDGRVRAVDILLENNKLKKNRSIGRLAILDVRKSSNGTTEDGVEDVGEPISP